ncbi:hypothetical protein NZK35_31060 [Stieleria sp. ICT_E10.1]|uniref:methyltransferase family protein n=1 Tax=Stieleria sedimenti TaxID=2976331 RepID=UPI00217F5D50|nr:methyltransferase [Stieleria sedimenti]MCS7471119.1 hypothetical protein [Stieleria sedimenti]
MPPPPRFVDIAIGVSILSWAGAAIWSNLGQRPLTILIATSLLHLMVGVLFLLRRGVEQQGDFATCLMAVPAVLVGGWVFGWSPSDWNISTQLLFVSGSGLAILSFVFLGRCFAILPAIRGTVVHGPFSIIRHPAYLGELAMVVACVVAAGLRWEQLVILLFIFALFAIRIRVEERLLLSGVEYQRYCRKVRWRLIPLIW